MVDIAHRYRHEIGQTTLNIVSYVHVLFSCSYECVLQHLYYLFYNAETYEGKGSEREIPCLMDAEIEGERSCIIRRICELPILSSLKPFKLSQ